MQRSIPQSPSNLRVFNACLLSFMILIAPIASVAAATLRATTSTRATSEAAKPAPEASESSLFVRSTVPMPIAGITATMADSFTDADGDGKADKGQTITYTATLTNTTGASVTGVSFTDTPDANTTLDPTTVHASPIAFDDTYNWVGNTVLDTSFRSLPSITANDTIATAPDTKVLNTSPTVAPLHGSVVISSNGHFVYTPAVGYMGSDSFTYTLSNSADSSLVGTGTVTINMPTRVWYLDGGSAGGDGRSHNPSNSPTAMSTAADAASDIFYVFSDLTTLNGTFTLDNNQQLLGQGVALNLSGFGVLFPAISRPTIASSVSGNAVTLGSNNALAGFNIGTTSGTAIFGTSVGTLNINNASISTSGAGLDLTGVSTPTVSITLDSVTSVGGAKNINLVGLNGAIALGSGALSGSTSGATNHAFAVSGGNASITYSGSITKANTGNVVNISGRTGNTVTLSGTINGSSSNGINISSNTGGTVDFTNGTKTLNTAANAAVTLSSNTNATINFSNGGLDIDTTSGKGFEATGGGTVTVTTGGNNNTIDTTTGTALNVTGTTIGANGLTFFSISSDGASNGIVLNNTGSSGGLTVTGGSGGFCGGVVSGSPRAITTAPVTADCTGGRIQNSSGADGATSGIGISLTNTQNVSLSRMRIDDHSNFAIRGNSVTGFTLTNSLIDGANGTTTSPDEGSISFTNLLGTSSITSSTVRGGFEDNINVLNNTGTGTLTITDSTVRDNTTTNGNDGVFAQADAGATFTLKVKDSVLQRNRGDHVNTTQSGNGIINTVVTGNTMTFNGTIGDPFDPATTAGGSVTLTTGANFTGTSNFNVSNNNITGAKTSPININNTALTSTAGGIFTGTISNNIIGKAGSSGSGSDGDGIDVTANGNANITVTITSNNIRQWKLLGINLVPRDGAATMNATVQGNTVTEPFDLVNSGQAILFNGGPATTETGNSCVNIGGSSAGQPNILTGPYTPAILPLRVRQRAVNTITLPGYAGGPTDTTAVNTYLSGRNGGAGATSTVNSPPGGGFIGGAACTLGSALTRLNIYQRDDLAQADNTSQPVDEAKLTPAISISRSQIYTAHSSTKTPKAATRGVSQSVAFNNPDLQSLKSANQRSAGIPSNKEMVTRSSFSHHARRSSSLNHAGLNNAAVMPAGPNVNVTIGTLPNTKSVTIKFQVTVNNSLTPNSTTQVQTQGTFAGSFGSQVTNDPDTGTADDATVTLIARSDLTMTSKTDGVTTILPGGTLTYTLSYKNNGRSATGVVLTETVPAGTTADSAFNTPLGWTCTPDGSAGNTCTNTIGALAFNATGTKQFKVTVNSPAAAGLNTISNTASIADDGAYEPDINPGDNSKTDNNTTLNAAPDFNISKTDGDTNTSPGDNQIYTITFSNVGNQDATGVVLTDTVPAGTTFTTTGSSAWTGCADGAAAGSVCTIAVGNLAGGGGNTGSPVTFAVNVISPATAGQASIVNTASIADDLANGTDPTLPNTTTDIDTLDANSDLALTKTPDISQAIPGQTITYTLNYSNIGNQGATGVVITETVPTDTTFDSAGSSPTVWSCPDNSAGLTSCTTTIGSVAGGGANGTAKFAVKVIATPVGTSITNTATIDDDNANPVDPPGNDSTGSIVTPLCSNPVVINTNDTGAGSLRQAITDVCDGGTITFNIPVGTDPGCNAGAGPCTITLATELTISKSLTIDGPTAESVIVSGANTSRVFEITAGTVTINDLTISNGKVSGSSNGAGISNAGTLSLTGVTVSGNLTVPDASGNTGGGGMFNSGTLTLTNSTVSGNHADTGIDPDTGVNPGKGAGILNTGTLTLTNCTVSDNVAGMGGEGGGINNANTANLQDTIVANNTVGAGGAGPDLKGAFNSLDYNLFETTTDATFTGTTTHNITGEDPVLGPLQDNGGPTFTHALLAGSPAIDAGNSALTTDQRGNLRPADDGSITNVGNGSDIGAFEVPDPTAPTADIVDVTPDPRNTGVSSITIVFSEAISGFDLTDLSLTRDAGAVALTGATLGTSDNITFTLGNLDSLTNSPGTYVLTLTASTSGITDASANPLAGDASDTWVMETTAPTLASTDIVDDDADDTVLVNDLVTYTVTFNEDIDSATVDQSDFANTGTSSITIGTITETSPGVFTVEVTPTTAGTLILQVGSGIDDTAGNSLAGPVSDDTTLTVVQNNFTTFEVNTTEDSDDGACTALGAPGEDCTLREAIALANTDAGAETITFDPTVFGAPGPHIITLASELPHLSSDIAILGPGADLLTVQRDTAGGTPDFNVFFVLAPAGIPVVTISGLTITNGSSAAGGSGGGIFNGGTLTVANCVITGNHVTSGGGGGILNQTGLGVATLVVYESTISGNTADTFGGGIYNYESASGTTSVTIVDSTISGNAAQGLSAQGGGIASNGGIVTVINSTISGNTATGEGGGIFSDGTTTTLSNATITNNRADNDDSSVGNPTLGGGLYVNGGTAKLRSTIIAGNFRGSSGSINEGDDDVFGALDTGSSHNLIGLGTADMTGISNGDANGNQVGAGTPIDAKLGALADNDGETLTHSLQPGSPAINAGTDLTALSNLITNVQTTFDVVDASAIPDGIGYAIRIEDEQMLVITKSGNTLTVVRAANGSTAASHAAGAAVNYALDQRCDGHDRKVFGTVDIGSFEVQAGTADHLVFNVQPSNSIAGASITPAVTVRIVDAGNNLTTSTANVTVAIGSNPGTATLGGTTTVAAVNGTATFNNLSINKIGVGYTLTASSTGLPGATSNTFNVTSPATVSGTKTVSGTFKVGNTVTYTVVLSNSGPGTQLDNPTNEFTDTLPVGLTLVSATASSGITSTGGNTATWNGAIASGSSVTITILATINNGQAGNTIANQGTINYDSNGDGANDTAALTGNAVGNNNPTSFVVNNLPTISAVGVTRTAGSSGSNSTIANVNDVEDAENTLAVTVNNGSSATVNGVSVSNLSVSAAGVVTADVVAACGATTATFTLRVTDSLGDFNTETLTVTVNANTAPTLSYNNPPTVVPGGSASITPVSGPSDNGSISTIVVQNQGTYTGTISVNNSTGVVLISNAAPTGTHTIVIRATDNCGTTRDASFDLVVAALPTISINDVSQAEGNSGTTNFTFNVTLSTASALTVTVDFATANGTATTADSDYQSQSGTLTFAPGDPLTKTVTVLVNGDTRNEPNETFSVNLTNAQNANIADNQGLGSIQNDDTPLIQFNSATYTIGEGDLSTPEGYPSLSVQVKRTGDTSGAATVHYATSDLSGTNECDVANSGNASQRCDYLMLSGTLRFAPGDASKTFHVPIVNDGYVEGSEQFTIDLTNVTGATLGPANLATVTITDNDTTATDSAHNPYLSNDFFVRMHYVDFLEREPDHDGFADWTSVLNGCGPQHGFLGAPANCDRAHISKGFFGATEFIDRGFLVYRLYEVGLNRLPLYAEYNPDAAQLRGFAQMPAPQDVAQLQINLDNYLTELAARPEFVTRYASVSGNTTNDATALILMLESTAQVTLPASAAVVANNMPPQYGRAELINLRTTNQLSVVQTVKAFVEQKVVYDREYPRGFVTMQYFAYLHRDPDPAGWADWLNVLLNGKPSEGIAPGDFNHLIFGFIYSNEYRKRFGQP